MPQKCVRMSTIIQSLDQLLVRPGGCGRPRPEVAPAGVHGLHGLAPAQQPAPETVVPVVHDAVAVVRRVQVELQRVPGIVDPLVGQHVQVVDAYVLVPDDGDKSVVAYKS